MKRVVLHRLVINEKSPEQTLYLKEEAGKGRVLPIVIGVFEANAIHMGLYGVDTPRPMTHDLFLNTLRSMDVELKKIVISELVESTFLAELHISSDAGLIIVDSRPSDAIALSARADIPIFVTDNVFDRASISDVGSESE